MEGLIKEYLAFCRDMKRLDAKTLKAYQIDLGQLAALIGETGPGNTTPERLQGIFTIWHGRYKPKTVKRKMASVKAFFHWLQETGHIGKNPMEQVYTAFREPKTLPRTIPEHSLECILQAAYDIYKKAGGGKKARALRDIVILELLFATGMRVSELCSLKPDDINLVEGEVLIHGKGRKERVIQLPDPALLKQLQEYQDAYQDAITGSGTFIINTQGRPATDSCVRRVIMKYAKQAGISQRITPHMFRHTFATLLLDADVNLRCIQEILGHSSIQTTEIYTHVSAAKQRQVLAACHPRKQLAVIDGRDNSWQK